VAQRNQARVCYATYIQTYIEQIKAGQDKEKRTLHQMSIDLKPHITIYYLLNHLFILQMWKKITTFPGTEN